MGVVQKQGIQSSIILYAGFAIGAFNILVLFPRFFTTEEFGLTRLLFAVASTFSGLALLGTNQMMIKFFPFYKDRLHKKENDFLFLATMLPIIGFVILCIVSYLLKDVFLENYSKRSSLFVHYFYLIYPLAFSLTLFTVFETYSRSLLKTVVPSVLRDLGYRAFTTFFIALFVMKLVSFDSFIVIFCNYYFIAVAIMLIYIYRMEHLNYVVSRSVVSKRLYKRILTYGTLMFGGSLFGILAENVDAFMIAGIAGLESTAIFVVASYVATIIQLPKRSITNILTPMVAQAWKDKNISLIDRMYKKSSINLMVTGVFLFLLVWVNIDALFSFLPPVYIGGKYVVLIMGISTIIDLSTGINGEILVTSSVWRVSFYSHVVLIALSIPTNYFLVKQFGIMGSAYSNLIAYSAYNTYRFVIIYHKYKMQPFTWNSLKCLIIGGLSVIVVVSIPDFSNPFISIAIKGLLVCVLFGTATIFFKVSDDINAIYYKTWKRFYNK
ncbi:MAG: oligosaccharide flippase family protein [Bacteroidetes bacterium]|nr:oligosaccharide flippase family protein [Bacteroidota bacterium]